METRGVLSLSRLSSPRGLFFLLAVAVAGLGRPASAQLVLGQYEDEAPLRSWNTLGAPSAAALGLGGAQFARAWDAAASLANPALLVSLAGSSIGVTASYSGASLFRYSLVNTGVLFSRGNLTAGSAALEYGGGVIRLGNWAVAASAGLLEDYGRPAAAVTGGLSLSMRQIGILRDYHLAVARRIRGGLALGVGLNVVSGSLNRNILEQSGQPSEGYTITDDKSERYRGVFLNAGLTLEISPRLTLGLAGRSPYVKKAEARSALRYLAPAGDTDIRIDAEAENTYRQPWVLGAGLAWRISGPLSGFADAAYFGWSRYSVVVFEENLKRPFRDIVRASAGLEYELRGRFFGRPGRLPLRVGLALDPQPMAEPRSTYVCLSAGVGLRSGRLSADAAGLFGRETGSGNSLGTAKAALTLAYRFGRDDRAAEERLP